MKRILLFALVVMGVAAASPVRADDDTLLVIDAGRLGAMMDQVQQMLQLPPDPPTADAPTEPFAILQAAVREYETLQPQTCAMVALGDGVCGALYRPAWLDDAATPASTVLRRRIDEASGHLMPLWNAMCAKDQDPGLCQIE